MSKGSRRLSAPWVGAALLGVGVVTAGACGGIADEGLFDTGAASGAAGTGGVPTTSTSSTMETTSTSTGLGGAATSTTGSNGSSMTTTASTTASSTSGGPTCGDSIRDPGEQCDNTDFGPLTCASLGFSDPTGLVCKSDCTVDESGCAATCDGQKVEMGEVCDGALLNGHTCNDLGYSKPNGLKCTTCQLDGAGCKATCGNGKLEPTEQCDDNNMTAGDGCDATCHIETTGPTGLTCATAIPISIGLGTQNVSGTTVGGGGHTAQGCASGAPDRVYAVKATANGFLTANLVRSQTSFDSVLYLASACSDANANADVLCNDSRDPLMQASLKGGEVVSVRVQQNQTYYLFVDGRDAGAAGTYQIHFSLSSGTDCNDPVTIPLESGTGMTVLGSNNNIFVPAQGTCGGGSGGQVIYSVIRTVGGKLDVATVDGSTNYNSVLYARSTCNSGNSELDCSNNGGTAAEAISMGNVNGGAATYVYVDGSIAGGGSPAGNYGVTFTP
jgi:cysteine-rich repeat protein